MNVTFLHVSDIHIGIKLSNKGFSLNNCKKRRVEIFETFEKIIELVKENNIEYLFISGNMVDENYCSFKDFKLIITLLENIIETKVIICFGPSDSYTMTSLYELVEWPSNVYFFKNYDRVQRLQFKDVDIYSMSILNNDKINPKLIYDTKLDNSKINILLLNVPNSNIKENEIDWELLKYKFNYCALGNKHKYTEIYDNIKFPGSPEPYEYDSCCCKHGVIKGEVSKKILNTTFIPVSKTNFIYREVNVSIDNNFNQIMDKIKSIGISSNPTVDFIKVRLSGKLNNNVLINKIEEEAKEFFTNIVIEDNYTYELNSKDVSNKIKGNIIDNYIAQFEKINNNDKVYQRAFELGLKELKVEGGVD